MSTREKIVYVVIGICGLLTMGATMIWAQPCSGVLELANGNAAPMRCNYTARIATLLGLVLVILAIVSLVSKHSMAIPVLLVAAAMIIITFDSALGIGVCKSKMPCWTTAAWIRTCAGIAIAAGLVGLVGGKGKKQVPPTK